MSIASTSVIKKSCIASIFNNCDSSAFTNEALKLATHTRPVSCLFEQM